MSYTKRPDIIAGNGELVVQLDDTAALVAVSCTIGRGPVGYSFRAMARAINEDGTPFLDGTGNPVRTEFPYAAPQQLVETLGTAPLTLQCMLAVLGEPTTMDPPWADSTLTSVSIRTSLAVAPDAGVVDAGAVL